MPSFLLGVSYLFSLTTENNSYAWLLTSWSKTNLQCALPFVKAAPGLANPNLVIFALLFLDDFVCFFRLTAKGNSD